MDYLVRDALHTGATAGHFDYHRLLNTLTVIEHPITGSPVLAIEAGGLHSAEALLLARYFMFVQVYFHDVRRIYDVHLVDFLAGVLPGGRFPSELGDYVRYTDNLVHTAISMAIAEGGRNGELAGRLVDRRHFRQAYEVSAQEKAADPEIFPKLTNHVNERFGDLVRTDEAGKEPHTLEAGRMYILRDDGTPQDIFQESQLIPLLRPIWKARVYARKGVEAEVHLACEEFIRGGGAAT